MVIVGMDSEPVNVCVKLMGESKDAEKLKLVSVD
jgi:hypothetical protein